MYEVHDVCVFWFSRWKTSGCRNLALRDLQQYPLDELLLTIVAAGEQPSPVRINDTLDMDTEKKQET